MAGSDFYQIDHLIFGAPNLEAGIVYIEQRLGVRPAGGGRHLDFGTHNALLKIGPATYLEVIAPDPTNILHKKPLWMGLKQVTAPKLIWWAAKASLPEQTLARARSAGWDPGEFTDGSRQLPDGRQLSWQLTDPFHIEEGGTLPFLIDWGTGHHPTDGLADTDCKLIDFELFHPEPERIRRMLSAVNLDIKVVQGMQAGIKAGFSTSRATVYL